MPSSSRSSRSSWSTMSGNGYPAGNWVNGDFDPRLFSNSYQGPYPINPQQMQWGNSRIMNWIPRPQTGSWSAIYPPDYRGWR